MKKRKDKINRNECEYRIIESIDGIYIEEGFWFYDGANGEDPYDTRWHYMWEYVDYFGRDSWHHKIKKYIYKSVDDAKKRLDETNYFSNLVLEKVHYV